MININNKFSPGVILKTKFIKSTGKEFSSYIDYIDRETAVRNDMYSTFSLYNEYMFNSEKSSGLFTDTKNSLTSEEIKTLKQSFEKAQKQGSLMWQNVISFDNRWLEKLGVYNSKTGYIDESKVRNITRLSTKEMLDKKGMISSSIWSASIHYNTDNIHIHIAIVEPNPVTKRGMIKQKDMEKMKSKVVNNLLDISKSHEKINQLIREDIIKKRSSNLFIKDIQLNKIFKEIHKKLPEDKRMWNYKINGIKEIRPLIDKLSAVYISTYHKEEFSQLKKILEEKQKEYNKAYGKSDKNFVNTKLDDLNTRMGNSILKEIKEYDKNLKLEKYDKNKQEYNPVSRMKNSLKKDFKKSKNQHEFEKLQRELSGEIEINFE